VFTDINELSGTIPSEIMRLKEVSELFLDQNWLKGPIPAFQPKNNLNILLLGKDFDEHIFGF